MKHNRRNTDNDEWPASWSDLWPYIGSALVVIILLAMAVWLMCGAAR